MILTYKLFKNNKNKINEKAVQQTVLTKSYLEDFFKNYGFTLNAYIPMLNELSIKILIAGDKSKYEKMINRLISLHYKNIKEVNTIKKGEEFKIFINEF